MPIQVLNKTFRVLEALTDAPGALPLVAVARLTGLPKPTACRILRSLAGMGYVVQQADGHYLTTGRLARLGRRGAQGDLERRALPALERLHRRFDETVNLGVLEGSLVRYLRVLETTRPLRRMASPNATDPFYCTALGRAMVSRLPPEDQRTFVARAELRAWTPHTVRSRRQLARILAETRARGWAVDDEETDGGVICFAVPLMEKGRPVAAVSISLPKNRLTPRRKQQMLNALGTVRLEEADEP